MRHPLFAAWLASLWYLTALAEGWWHGFDNLHWHSLLCIVIGSAWNIAYYHKEAR